MRALLCWLAAAVPAVPGAQEPAAAQPPARIRFQNLNRTFAIDLPAGWRQLAPDETRRLRATLPPDLHRTEPLMFYAVGPVDRWLRGDFDGVHLQVIEQADEWVLGNDFAPAVAGEWRRLGEQSGVQHEIADVRRVRVGEGSHEAIECLRRSVPKDGGHVMRSLDVYAGTGGRQVLLSFRCREADFAARLPEFRSWIDTIAFAQKARGPSTLADRLWTPIVTGLLVGVMLGVLYRMTRRRG